jgi:tight adherence protein B
MRLVAIAVAAFAGFAAMGLLLGVPVELPARRPRRRDTQRRRRWLRQAGATVTPAQFYTVSAAMGLAVFAGVWAATAAWTIAAVPALLAVWGPPANYAAQRRRRLDAVKQAWPDGLRDLVASVNAGLPLHQALCELAVHGPEPLRDACAGYATNARVSGVAPALERIKEELADPTSDRVLEVLILAHERGPQHLPRILDGLAQSIGRDLRTAEEIETAKKEPKLNMAVAAAMPWIVLVVTSLGDTPQRAYYASGRGLGVIVVSAALTFAGIACVRALAHDAVEHRLFVSEERGHG